MGKHLSTVKFNKISIVESLGSSDKKTGEALAHDLNLLEVFHDKGVTIEFLNIDTPEELLIHIKNLSEDAGKGTYPILQIEAHGSEDKQSLVLNKGSIRWLELEPSLRELNVSTKCNLIVVMATCFGAFASAAISLLDRAPFWGIIGPETTTSGPQILSSLTNFYTAIYSGDNSKKLLESLNSYPVESQLKLMTCEWFFIKAYRYYIHNYCNEKVLDERVIRVKKRILLQGAKAIPDDKEVLEFLRPKGRLQFEAWLNNFFMVDLFPENVNKISAEYEEIDL